jgi:hypothetical protein
MQARPLEWHMTCFLVDRDPLHLAPLHLVPLHLAPLHRCQELMEAMVIRYGEAKSRRGKISSLCQNPA